MGVESCYGVSSLVDSRGINRLSNNYFFPLTGTHVDERRKIDLLMNRHTNSPVRSEFSMYFVTS